MNYVPETTAHAEPTQHRHWGVTLLWLTPVLFLLTIVVYSLLTRPPTSLDDPTPRVGQPLPDFTLPDLQGNKVQLSALRGKVVFINIWATWCPPCVEEMPTMQRLYDRLHDRGLEVLAISIDALGAQVVKPFMQQYRLTFPALLDPTVQRAHNRGNPKARGRGNRRKHWWSQRESNPCLQGENQIGPNRKPSKRR